LEGRRRILVLGDSFVWGDGYSNANDIWWRQLERELRQRGYGDVDVIAAGVNGASTQDQLRWLKTLGIDGLGSPDVIIFGYVTNDPDVRRADGSPYVKQLGDIASVPRWRFLDKTLGRVAPNLTAQLQQRRIAKVQSRIPDVYPYAEWERKLLEPPNLDAYRGVVHDLAATMRMIGVPYFFITLPNSPDRARFTERYAPIEPLFAAAAIPFHNILDDFVAAYPLGSEVLQWGINPANGHPGPVSTRFYARKAADILERQYPHLLGVKSPGPIAPVLAIND
jgi:lysophospholipase L1-like esterase